MSSIDKYLQELEEHMQRLWKRGCKLQTDIKEIEEADKANIARATSLSKDLKKIEESTGKQVKETTKNLIEEVGKNVDVKEMNKVVKTTDGLQTEIDRLEQVTQKTEKEELKADEKLEKEKEATKIAGPKPESGKVEEEKKKEEEEKKLERTLKPE